MASKTAFRLETFLFGLVIGLLGILAGSSPARAAPGLMDASARRSGAPRLLDATPLYSNQLLHDIGQLSRIAPSRAPATAKASEESISFSSPLLTTLGPGEPAWYRDPAGLSLGAPTPTPRPNDLLGSDRAPSHPVDGMWRHYDSRGLSR